jgi:predicted  nucleic acid-binding Zn-ribbon protein
MAMTIGQEIDHLLDAIRSRTAEIDLFRAELTRQESELESARNRLDELTEHMRQGVG